MAYFDLTARAAGTTLAGRLAHLMTRPLGVLADWNARRVTRKLLNRLSDHELDDIGLTRDEIDAM